MIWRSVELRHGDANAFTGMIEDPLSTFRSDQKALSPPGALHKKAPRVPPPRGGGGGPCDACWRGRTSPAPPGSPRPPPPPRGAGGDPPPAPRPPPVGAKPP